MIASADQFRGQQQARDLLDAYLAKRRLAGTILIMGQRGLGKTTLATVLARALVCEENRDEPRLAFCGECYACRSIARGEQPEYVTLRPRSQDITVGQVEEEVGGFRSALLHPTLLSHRIFLIDDAHHLNETTSNQMLKLFEEAPEQTVFILVTDRPEMLLPTILSRGQKMRLLAEPVERLAPVVAEDAGVAAEVAAEAARMAGGRYVEALALAADANWRGNVKRLAGALLAGRGIAHAAADLAELELADMWAKQLAAAGLSEDEAQKKLAKPKTDADKGLKVRLNELKRQALTGAYDRASWWLLATASPRPGFAEELWQLKQRISANVDPALAQAAFELGLR